MRPLLVALLLVPGWGTTHTTGQIDCAGGLSLQVLNQSTEPVQVWQFGQLSEWFEPGETLEIYVPGYVVAVEDYRAELRLVRKRPGQKFHSSVTSVVDIQFSAGCTFDPVCESSFRRYRPFFADNPVLVERARKDC